MNSGNPAHDATDHFNQVEFEERTRIAKAVKCDFCKRNFYAGGVQLEWDCACDDCVEDGTVRDELKDCGMSNTLIDSIFNQSTKIEH